MDIEKILDAIASSTGGVLRVPDKYLHHLNSEYCTHWRTSDMESAYKAREIGRLYLSHYCRPSVVGRMPTEEDAVRIWFGGPLGWVRDWTVSHWLRVRPYLSTPQVAGNENTTTNHQR